MNNYHRLTCMVSSPWRSCSRLTMVCSLWDRTLVFLSLVLSSRPFRRGLMRATSMGGIVGSLNTHHSTRSDTSLMSLDWFWRHCVVTETRRRHDTKTFCWSSSSSQYYKKLLTCICILDFWVFWGKSNGFRWKWMDTTQAAINMNLIFERQDGERISWLDLTVKLRTRRGSDTLLYLLIYS